MVVNEEARVTSYREDQIRKELDELLESEDLSWDEFTALGEADELIDIDPLLDFVYRAVLPALTNDAA